MQYNSSANISFKFPTDRLLWKFLAELLNCQTAKCVSWEDRQRLTFQIVDPDELAELWGVEKCKPGMTYEKLSRALRYYYKMNIIAKVPGKRLTYRYNLIICFTSCRFHIMQVSPHTDIAFFILANKVITPQISLHTGIISYRYQIIKFIHFLARTTNAALPDCS